MPRAGRYLRGVPSVWTDTLKRGSGTRMMSRIWMGRENEEDYPYREDQQE